jgi:putative tryptophan/tyrosine transport system substrate-binding protein
MNRRKFLILSTTAGLLPVAARSQGPRRTIGVLMAGSEGSAENAPRIAAFRGALTELGWRDGDNVDITYRWSAGKNELVQQYAKELVERAPDVILANSTTVISALKSRTDSIPVVFALAMDPVGLGQIKSLSHPGGNFTGFTFIDPELIGKWMELLGDAAPGLTQAGLLFNPDTMNPYPNFVREVQEAQKSRLSPKLIPVRTTEEMASAMQSLAASPGSGLMIGPDPFNNVHLKQMAELATKLRLPTISVYRSYVTEGGLMAYGPDVADVFRRSAAYVDRILKGEKPADLPVQQPNKFEFIINLKTAKALGLTVSPTLLATADETIE